MCRILCVIYVYMIYRMYSIIRSTSYKDLKRTVATTVGVPEQRKRGGAKKSVTALSCCAVFGPASEGLRKKNYKLPIFVGNLPSPNFVWKPTEGRL